MAGQRDLIACPPPAFLEPGWLASAWWWGYRCYWPPALAGWRWPRRAPAPRCGCWCGRQPSCPWRPWIGPCAWRERTLVAVAPAAPPLVAPPLARLTRIRRLVVRCCWHQGSRPAFGSRAVNWWSRRPMGAAPCRQRPVTGWQWKPPGGAWARPGGDGMARQPQRLLPHLWRGLQPLVMELEQGLPVPVRSELPAGPLLGLALAAQLVALVLARLAAGLVTQLVAGAICRSGSAATAVSCRSCPVTPACG